MDEPKTCPSFIAVCLLTSLSAAQLPVDEPRILSSFYDPSSGSCEGPPQAISAVANIPGQCNPIYHSSSPTPVAWMKMSTVCSMSAKFLEYTYFTDAACTGTGTPTVVALSNVGCNRKDTLAFTVKCTSSSSAPELPYFFVEHTNDTQCRHVTSTSVVANTAHPCAPVFDPDRTTPGWVSTASQCTPDSVYHTSTFFTNSTCSGQGLETHQLVNQFCHAVYDTPSPKGRRITCYASSAPPSNQNVVVMRSGVGTACSEVTSTATFSNVAGRCSPVHDSATTTVYYAKLDHACVSSDKFMHVSFFSDATCLNKIISVDVGVGKDRCNFVPTDTPVLGSEPAQYSAIPSFREFQCFSSTTNPVAPQDYVYVKKYPTGSGCQQNSVMETWVYPNVRDQCVPISVGGFYHAGHKKLLQGCPTTSLASIQSMTYGASDTSCTGTGTFELLATGNDVCNSENTGTFPSFAAQCFGNPSIDTSGPPNVPDPNTLPTNRPSDVIFFETFSDNCETPVESFISPNLFLDSTCIQVIPYSDVTNPLWIKASGSSFTGEYCHPDSEFLDVDFFTEDDCSPSSRVEGSWALALGKERCNRDAHLPRPTRSTKAINKWQNMGVRVRCATSQVASVSASPYVYAEVVGQYGDRGSVTFRNIDTCHAVWPGGFNDEEEPSHYKLDRVCGPSSSFLGFNVLSSCSGSPSAYTTILKTSPSKGLEAQCFGAAPSTPSGPSSYIVHLSGPNSQYNESETWVNDGTCSPVFDIEGRIVRYAMPSTSHSICSSLDRFFEVSFYSDDSCTASLGSYVWLVNGPDAEVNIENGITHRIDCYGSNAAASTSSYYFLAENSDRFYCDRKTVTNTYIVPNVANTCIPRHSPASDPTAWVKFDHLSAHSSEFVSSKYYSDSSCTEGPNTRSSILKLQSGGLNVQGFPENSPIRDESSVCNVGESGSGAVRISVYAPGVAPPAADTQKFVFLRTGLAQTCGAIAKGNTDVLTSAFANKPNMCNKMFFRNGETPTATRMRAIFANGTAFAMIDQSCTTSQKFSRVRFWSNSECSGNPLTDTVLRLSDGETDQCNIINGAYHQMKCFGDSSQAPAEDYIFSKTGDLACFDTSITNIVPNIARSCSPVILANGHVSSFVSFASPASPSSKLAVNVYTDSGCTNALAQSLVKPDSSTCNLQSAGSMSQLISATGGSSASGPSAIPVAGHPAIPVAGPTSAPTRAPTTRSPPVGASSTLVASFALILLCAIALVL